MEDEEEEVAVLEGEKSKSIDVDLEGGGSGGGGGGGGGGKVARLPRWTRQEILVLIQGKRVAENRVRRGRSTNASSGGVGDQEEVGVVQMAEPKWATVSSYCKRHGVNRGPVQCRKRWSNLAGDYKKIKEWECQIKDESESFWLMRNDFRRDRKLPGFFDKEVFDILNSINNTNTTNISGASRDTTTNNNNNSVHVRGDEQHEVVFDSGRSAAADDGLFSDFEQSTQQQQQQQQQRKQETEQQQQQQLAEHPLVSPTRTPTAIPAPTPISEKQYKYQPMSAEASGPGTNHEKQQDELNPEMGSTSREGRKRRRFSQEENNGEEGDPLQDQLIQVLEKNGRIINSQLDAYNLNLKLDREERKDHATSLVAVLNKLADSLGRIADKL